MHLEMKRWGAAVVTAACLLCALSDFQVAGQIVDVCATCHANATCEDKPGGSGKVCNCMYGFVGNGRIYCQDKDECKIGATKICGLHTSCHNTYGSYYCTCQAGYSPSNSLVIFIPNDGTHCQDIDECRIPGICGEGGKCRNLQGGFNCHCQVGYKVHNGTEPFHPRHDQAFCKVIDCGDPPSVTDAVQLSGTGKHYGSVARFGCEKGFLWKSGDNTSVCGVDGQWIVPSLVCEEVDCGVPPDLPHSVMLWDNRSSMGSEVVYQCSSGYHNVGEGNGSVCTAGGQWNKTTFLCQEVDCGEPPFRPHSKMIWDHVSRMNSVVYYLCDKGYFLSSGKDYTVCENTGFWEENDLHCEEISCGQPQILQYTNILWDNTTGLGSMVEYVCMDGFYKDSGNSLSACRKSGEWEKVTLKCKAKCGPAPYPVNSEVIWHNRSAVLHGCMKGHHSWKGSNMSVCDDTGKWQEATLRCRVNTDVICSDLLEIKPAISELAVFYDKCLRWKAEKYEEDTENYRVVFSGFRTYQRNFHDKRKMALGSDEDQLEVCLDLLPVTNYTITVTAVSARFTSTISANTSLQVPQAPEVFYREFETPFPNLWLRRSASTLDPISYYQVFVLPLEGTLVFDCASPKNPDFLRQRGLHGQYITAQVHLKNVGREMNFSVGDAHYYEGYYNAPLLYGTDYYIILRAVSQWRGAFKHSCVLWAKVRGTSYVMMMSAVFVSAAIGLLATVVIVGYLYTTFTKTHCCFRCGQSN
ncbi:sushi domain-containing protein 1 isoform X5 [Osmerus mordax]|uniref:sushi domain-containing protein 1 isoform X5 n=1 Tax=Osmerus mordax TaxID=8014 RepID=UPI003510933F